MTNSKFSHIIPSPVLEIGKVLSNSGFSAYLVGGCVRDLLLERKVKDWDVATSAKPEEILKLFPDSFYNNTFGTVGAKTKLGIIEITTYRKESKYTDARHPDKVIFAKTVEEDLERRDFTINALAINFKCFVETQNFATLQRKIRRGKKIVTFGNSLSPRMENAGPGIEGKKKNLLTVDHLPRLGSGEYPDFMITKIKLENQEKDQFILDKFSGLVDLEESIIRAVGNPEKRFQEDALRLIRAVRFSVELGFKIEKNTAKAIKTNAKLLGNISSERIRDEFSKILLSDWPAEGVVLLRKLGLLRHVVPVLEEGIGVQQNWHHLYTVYKHSVLSLKFCFSDSLELRLAALLHDTAKPRVKKVGEGGAATFYYHEMEGAKIARRVLTDLRYPARTVDEVYHLIRFHMFNYDPALHNESTVRRMLHRVGGIEWMRKLLTIRIADRLGSGCKQGEVFKLRKLKYLMEKVSKDPVSLKQLKIDGRDLMDKLGIKPGPQVGSILEVLLATIIADPKNNEKKKLLELAEGLWLAEKNTPGFLVKEKLNAEKYLEGKRKNHDMALQDKYRVRENHRESTKFESTKNQIKHKVQSLNITRTSKS